MWFKKKKNALVFIWYILHFCFLGAAATLWNGTKTSQTLFSCCGKSLSGQCALMWSEESEVALWQMDHWPVKDMLLVGSDSVASFRKKKHICVAMCLCAVGCQVSVMSYLYACVYGVDCGCCGWMWRWLFCWLWGGGVLILAGWCWLLSLQCWLANKFQLGGEKCVLCKETSGPTTNSSTKSSLDWSDPMYVTDPDSLVLLIDCHFPTASNFLHFIHFLFVTFWTHSQKCYSSYSRH